MCKFVPVNFCNNGKVFCVLLPKILKIKISSHNYKGLLADNRQVHDIVPANFRDDEKVFC